jgi:hypothetical protein
MVEEPFAAAPIVASLPAPRQVPVPFDTLVLSGGGRVLIDDVSAPSLTPLASRR